MKKILGLVALATLLFASCQKEQGTKVDQSPKAVTLNILNASVGTKSADEALSDGTSVTLNNLQVFFSDGTNLYKGKTISGGNLNHYYELAKYGDNDADQVANDNVAQDRVFHFLDPKVTKVIVVGNFDDEITAATEAALHEKLTAKYLVEEQQDDTKLDLYGTADLTTASGEDSNGHPLYRASVNLKPVVSRMQVLGFNYALTGKTYDHDNNAETEEQPVPRKYASITVDQVVFNGWYKTAEAPTGAAKTWNQETTKINKNAVFGYFSDQEALTGTKLTWATDMLTETNVAVVDLKAENYAWAPTAATGVTYPVYNFFPNGTDVTKTQLVVKLTATDANGYKTPLYLATNGFNPALTQTVAQIYNVTFTFDDDDLQQPEKCVDVNVTVASWNVVPVTPTFPEN